MSDKSALEAWISTEGELPEYRCHKYAKADVAERLAIHGIVDPNAVHEIWFTLERAGRDFLRSKTAIRRDQESLRKSLEGLKRALSETYEALQALEPQPADTPEVALAREAAKNQLHHAGESLAIKAIKIGIAGGRHAPDEFIVANSERMLAEVRWFQATCRVAIGRLDEGRAGRRANHRLHLWVYSVSRAWQEAGQSLRNDPQSYKGGTPYSRFLEWALSILDPSELPSLPSALAKHRTEKNRLEKQLDCSQ